MLFVLREYSPARRKPSKNADSAPVAANRRAWGEDLYCASNHPPSNPAARKPLTMYSHLRISCQIIPVWKFSIMITVGPSLIPK
jgi:hypothetical protein